MWRALVVVLVASLIGIQDAEAQNGGGKKGGGKKGGGKKGGERRELTMEAGTVQLGGQVTLDIYSGDTIGVTFAPQGGYFVADNVELLGEVNVSHLGGTTFWQVAAGGRYFIDLDDLWLYLGATVGYGEVSFGTFSDDAIVVTGLPGLLFPLSKNVGLDLGARVQIVNAGGSTASNVHIGYLGVQAFFK